MPELIDIRNEDGSLTGETMARLEAHRTESWHGVALVWLYDSQGRILLQERAAHLNTFPEKWDVTVSGHLTASDKPLETATRELAEELGIYVKPEELEPLGERPDSFALIYGKIHHEYDYVYALCQDVDNTKLELQAAEVLDTRWVTAAELEHDLQDPVRSQHYSGRNRWVYEAILTKVKQSSSATVV